jgi:uncharacterized membrane protein
MISDDRSTISGGVIALIKALITREDVHSVSFPYAHEGVWRALVAQQKERAAQTGLYLQHAFGLSGPDSGLSFDTASWGGYVHIPYEGMCEGDLIVKPHWRSFIPEAAMGEGDLTAAMGGKACHHLIVQGERAELDSAERTVVDGWTHYTSKRAYRPCNPFLEATFDPFAPLPKPDMAPI